MNEPNLSNIDVKNLPIYALYMASGKTLISRVATVVGDAGARFILFEPCAVQYHQSPSDPKRYQVLMMPYGIESDSRIFAVDRTAVEMAQIASMKFVEQYENTLKGEKDSTSHDPHADDGDMGLHEDESDGPDDSTPNTPRWLKFR